MTPQTQNPTSMQDIIDIEPIVTQTWAKWLPTALWALIFILTLVVLWILFRKWQAYRKRHSRQFSPLEQARHDLNQLQKSDLIEKQDWNNFYFELTEIFKRYFSREHALDILDKTTEEILPLKQNFLAALSDFHWESLKIFLTRSDQAKFAKSNLNAKQAQDDLELIRSMIESSRRLSSGVQKGEAR